MHEDLTAGAHAFPRALIPADATAIEVVFHEEPRPGGLSTSARDGRLDLYRYAPIDEDRAESRLSALDSAQRARLWRRRAVVSALMTAADRRFGWSSEPGWRLINGWPDGGDGAALNVDEWGFSRALGRRSAALDLATFLEELLISPSQLVRNAVPERDQVACQEHTKRRFVETLIRRIDPGWNPPSRPRCSHFEAWLSDVQAVEIVLSDTSTAAPESLFGHLYLHLVRGSEASQPMGAVYHQFAALTGSELTAAAVRGRGLSGGLTTALVQTPFVTLQEEIMGRQGRALRRFRMVLDAHGLRRVLERVWEAERRLLLEYRFIDRNCASAVLDLLAPVIDSAARISTPRRPSPVGPGEVPSAVVASLYEMGLLRYEAPDLLGADDAAVEAGRAARRLDRRIERLAGDEGPEYADQVAATRHPRERVRARAHAALAAVSERIGRCADAEPADTRAGAPRVPRARVPGTPGQPEITRCRALQIDLIEAAELRVRVERYRLWKASERLRALGARHRRPDAQAPTTADMFAARRHLTRRELGADELHAAATRDWQRRAARRAERRAEQRPAGETLPGALLPPPGEWSAYVAATDTHGTLIAAFGPQSDPGMIARARLLARAVEARRRFDRASATPSILRLWAGAGVLSALRGDPGPVEGLLRLRGSLLDQELGVLRRFGGRSDVGLRLIDVGIDVATSEAGTRVSGVDATLIAFRSALRPAVVDTPFDVLGWGGDLRLRYSPALGRDFETAASILGLLTLLASDSFERFALVEAGPDVRLRVSQRRVTGALGGTVALRTRLPLGGTTHNALRFDARASLLSIVPDDAISTDLEASVGIELEVGRSGHRALILTLLAQTRVELPRSVGELTLVVGMRY